MPDPAAFQELVSRLDYPMVVVTAAAGGERAGCLVGFATQCSLDPVRFLVCLSVHNRTFHVAERTELLAVHLLGKDRQDLAELFGSETGDRTDKFARCAWHPGPAGTPLLDGCPDRFVGRVVERCPLGDHVGFVLDVVDAAAGGAGPLLSFQDVRHLEPGHPA